MERKEIIPVNIKTKLLKCKKKSIFHNKFKFFAMACFCTITVYVLDPDPTFIIQNRIHGTGSASLDFAFSIDTCSSLSHLR